LAQLGILFDAQKLGSGFYGYTAFRILFSVAPPRDLLNCTLYHGEVGEGRARPYCIAIESNDGALLARIKQTFSTSMVRGLLPPTQRFMDDLPLQEEVLATAAAITRTGEITECSSRWLQEAWQRAQGQHSPASPETRHPDKVPLALRCSPGGRKALAFLLAFCVGGAAIPWVGWSIAICVTVFTAGLIEALAIRWQLWASESLSGDDVMAELRKFAASKQPQELATKLASAGPSASPLLRRIHASAGAADLAGGCLLAEQQQLSDRAALRGDIEEINLRAFGVLAVGAIAVAGLWVSEGQAGALSVLPRMTLVALVGFSVLKVAAKLIEIRVERIESQMQRLLAMEWMPTLVRSAPAATKALLPGTDQALQDLAKELQQMRMALERRRDGEFVDTMAGLRTSIEQLTPVLAGFREPFVLQAVPTINNRPKALSATA
jgi:hypothetical protein